MSNAIEHKAMLCNAMLSYAILYNAMFHAKYFANMLNNFALNTVDVKL